MKEKVLILSNAALSQSDSNGRTVAMLLKNYKPSQLAQIYTYGTPDFTLCDRFYRVIDGDALTSFIRRSEEGGVPEVQVADNSGTSGAKKRKKTPLNMLLREFVWKHGCWCKERLLSWLEEFKPEAIFLNLGDNIFFPELAIKLSNKYHIPIVVFSTEEYAFKHYNYITKRPSLFYWIFNWKLNCAYKKLGKYVEKGYFNTPLLKEEYQKRYPYPCFVAMNSSQMEWVENAEIKKPIKVSYLGNLGINRHLPLIEIANAVAKACPGVKLDIYGKIPNDTVRDAFAKCANINYAGFISYEDVTRIIHESTLVVHAESQEPFYIRDLRYAFSTKIADSISSGTPLLVYGNKTMAAIDLIRKENCAFVCVESKDLEKTVDKALKDVNLRREILENARKAKRKYFSGANIELISEN